MGHALLWVLLSATACRTVEDPPTVEDKHPLSEELSLSQADTEYACTRTDAGMWTQLPFRSDLWRDLAERADRRDAAAWQAMADLMEANRASLESSRCSPEIVRRVQESARRLSQDSPP